MAAGAWPGLCGPASAHAPIPGIGGFFSGALHPLVAPALLLALAALGLLLGQRAQGRIERARGGYVAYTGALALGLILTTWGGELDTDRLLLLCGALAGGTVALAWSLPPAVLASLAAVIGLATGLASPPSGVQGREYGLMLAGTTIASLLLPAWLLAVVCPLEKAWLRVAVRVLGSWLAAAALLALSLSFASSARA